MLDGLYCKAEFFLVLGQFLILKFKLVALLAIVYQLWNTFVLTGEFYESIY